MRKIIAAINMTLDGIFDHTAIIPDEGLHEHYAELLSNADAILYGRITYQLMEYWKSIVENPTGNQATDEFAVIMDKIPKVVFSHTLKSVDWQTARLTDREIEEEVSALKQQRGRDVLVGSRSIILQLMKLNLIDQYQLCVHPVIAGKGLLLFENIDDRKLLRLSGTKILPSGAIILYYEPLGEENSNS